MFTPGETISVLKLKRKKRTNTQTANQKIKQTTTTTTTKKQQQKKNPNATIKTDIEKQKCLAVSSFYSLYISFFIDLHQHHLSLTVIVRSPLILILL